MYEAILFYGIRRTIDESFIVDEMLLKEYGLGLSYDNEIITVNERLTILLPCVGRSEVHSLNPIGKTGWDDRFHRYAKAVGMGDYSIGWHVHLPETKSQDIKITTPESFPKDYSSDDPPSKKYHGISIDPTKIDWTRTTTGRTSSSKPNLSNLPSSGKITTVTVPADASEEEIRETIDNFFTDEEGPVGGKVVVREGVTVTDLNHEQLTQGKEDTLHSTLFGDLVEHGDGSWTVKYWRRGGSKLVAPLKFTIDVNVYGQPLVLSKHSTVKFVLEEGSLVEGLTKSLNKMFADYREMRRRGETSSEYEAVLLALTEGVLDTEKHLVWVVTGIDHPTVNLKVTELSVVINHKDSIAHGPLNLPFHLEDNIFGRKGLRDYVDQLVSRYLYLNNQLMPGQPYGPFETEEVRLANPSVPSGLSNFYRFMEMLDQHFSGDEVEPTWVFADKEGGGGIQQRAGDRWFVTGWKTDDLELIKPIEVQLHASIMGLTAGYEDYSGPTRTCPKVAVRDFVKWMFRYYEELGKLPVNEMSSQDVTDFDFLDKVIQQKSVEGEVAELREDLNEVSEKISESLKTRTASPPTGS
jgi:hypothetical protein